LGLETRLKAIATPPRGVLCPQLTQYKTNSEQRKK